MQGTRASLIFGTDKRKAMSDQEEKTSLEIVKSLMHCLGKFQQYPTINPLVMESIQELHRNLQKWLRTFHRFEAVQIQGNLQVNQSVLSAAAQQKDYLQALLFYMTERNVLTLEILSGISFDEIQQFLEWFSNLPKILSAKAISLDP